MPISFRYDINKEYENFRKSFNSRNHQLASPRQQEFFSQFTELNPENARAFVERYIPDHGIIMDEMIQKVREQWQDVGKTFYSRADKIFGIPFSHEPVTAWLTIHDRCSYGEHNTDFFIHLNLPTVNKTIMHELWHFYFYFSVGHDILQQHGRSIYNDIKESLTVLLNVIFVDLLKGATDKGYPQHAELRKIIAMEYEKTNSIFLTIDSALKYASKTNASSGG
jgi:hypothetical protein